MKYFYVAYETKDGGHEHQEAGLLSAVTVGEGQKKAEESKRIFERPGCERYCELYSVTEIQFNDYEVLKKYTSTLDSYFDRDNKLINMM